MLCSSAVTGLYRVLPVTLCLKVVGPVEFTSILAAGELLSEKLAHGGLKLM